MKLAIASALLLAIWAAIENNTIFVSKTVFRLNELPSAENGKKSVFISDIHIGRRTNAGLVTKKILRKIEPLSPQRIFLGGDIVTRDIDDISQLSPLLCGLRRIAPVYAVLGNHELDLMPDMLLELRALLDDCGVVLLDDSSAALSNGFFAYGATLLPSCYKNEAGGYRNLKKIRSCELETTIGKPRGCSLLIAHSPFFFDEYAKWGANLVLAGHVHGGSVRVPFVCGILSPERRFFPKFSSGIYREGNSLMLVSRGIGKLRLFCPKQIVLFETRCE